MLLAPVNVYIYKINEKNVYETNKKGPKMAWVPKVNTQPFLCMNALQYQMLNGILIVIVQSIWWVTKS